MGWRVTSRTFFIAPGATTIITFWWPPGSSDRGAQWAMAHPLPGNSDDWLMTERVGKHLVCDFGQVSQNGEPSYSCVQVGQDYEYRAFFTNDGTRGCRFQLEGGGVT